MIRARVNREQASEALRLAYQVSGREPNPKASAMTAHSSYHLQTRVHTFTT